MQQNLQPLVVNGQIIIFKGVKTLPLGQRNKRGFCKFHNFIGHKTSHYVLFRDLEEYEFNEGKLKFGDKEKTQIQVVDDPL